MKVIKMALKEEKQAKLNVEKELEAAMNRLEMQKKDIADKVNIIRVKLAYRMLSTNNFT